MHRINPLHWAYVLLQFVLILVGYILFRPDSLLLAGIGSSVMATGMTGLLLFLYVWLNTAQAEHLRILVQFGIVSIFAGRSVTIKGEYDERLRSATDHIDILGFGLRALRIDFSREFATWKTRARVRILLIDPEFPSHDSSFANQRDVEEGHRSGSIANEVHDFIRDVGRHVESDKFQIRLFRCLPSVNVFRIDDDLFWGPYLLRQESRNTPTFLVRRGGLLYQRLAEHFETMWTDDFSRPVPDEWFGRT